MVKTKVCYKCRIEKGTTEFYKNKSKVDGLSSSCKQCDLELKRDYYKRNREQKLAKALKYRKGKRAQLNERAKQYYQENKHRIRLKRKKHK